MDMFGPQLTLGHIVGLRVVCPDEILDKMRDKPLLEPERDIPVTAESGFEVVRIVEVSSPTKSIYLFEDYELTVELIPDAAARNLSYKVISGTPLYNIRWTIRQKVVKAKKT
jgi:hypothetical protein